MYMLEVIPVLSNVNVVIVLRKHCSTVYQCLCATSAAHAAIFDVICLAAICDQLFVVDRFSTSHLLA